MGLITCSECGREISDKAGSCPGCGCPVAINKEDEILTSEDSVKYGIISVSLCIIGIVLGVIINRGIFLAIPLIVFIISIKLNDKSYSKISSIFSYISITGCALIAFEVIKYVIFSLL